MATVFPQQPPVDHAPSDRTEFAVQDDNQTDVLQALSSDTAQQIVGTLADDPSTISDVAEAADTSLQNVRYHLDRLLEAGLVEPVDTWYSTKGKEMTVYGLTAERLVVQFDDA